MTTHLQIENISDDNNKSLFRSQRIKTNGKELVTPIRALEPNHFRPDTAINSDAFGVAEIYRELSPAQISTIIKDASAHDKFARSITTLSNRKKPSDIQFCFTNFRNDANPFPQYIETEVITDIAHSFSDITPIPILDTEITESNFDKYLRYITDCCNAIEELNHQPIMGALPNLPRSAYPKLIDTYLERGINSFYFDFHGSSPNPLKMRPVLRHLTQKKVLEDTFIYAINARPGRILKNSIVIPAKDFLAYGYHIDVLGGNHTRLKLPKVFFEKMRLAVAQNQKNKKRVFIRSDYGYYKTEKESEVSDVFPKTTSVSLRQIMSDETRSFQNLFNMEQQALEAKSLGKLLGELDTGESVIDYIKQKNQIQTELKHLQSGSKYLK